jgi:hypothetical protein
MIWLKPTGWAVRLWSGAVNRRGQRSDTENRFATTMGLLSVGGCWERHDAEYARTHAFGHGANGAALSQRVQHLSGRDPRSQSFRIGWKGRQVLVPSVAERFPRAPIPCLKCSWTPSGIWNVTSSGQPQFLLVSRVSASPSGSP